MKTLIPTLFAATFAIHFAQGQSGASFTNYLRQVQLPTEVRWDVQVHDEGEEFSPLAIDPGGARFELWTIQDNPFTSHLLDTKYVSTYTPVADLVIVTEDPYKVIPRTRADRPFDVYVETNGLRNDEEAPEAATRVHLMRHVQSYGLHGNADTIDRDQAILLQEVYLSNNQLYHYTFPINAIPAEDRTDVRGEERFSVYTINDYQSPASQLASMYVQVWPLAAGEITGITDGQVIRFDAPNITLTMEDLYPDSSTYAHVYPGPPSLGTIGKTVPGSGLVVYEAIPHDRTIVVDNWDSVIDQDGQWTMEILTHTPFGIDRLHHVTFTINRSIEVQGTVTTLD